MATYHSIYNVDFSNSTLWYKRITDVSVVVYLRIDKNYQASVKGELIDGDNIETLFEDEFGSDTTRKFIIDSSKLKIGDNLIRITTTDEIDSEDKICTFEHKIVIEDRDSFIINRCYDFNKEYLISGAGKIDINNKFAITTSAGFKTSMAVPKQAIDMDGRSVIRNITVNGDDDSTGYCESNVTSNNQEDNGDCYIQTIPLTEVMEFKTISKIQAIDASKVR